MSGERNRKLVIMERGQHIDRSGAWTLHLWSIETAWDAPVSLVRLCSSGADFGPC
jgi:hypothetical protein